MNSTKQHKWNHRLEWFAVIAISITWLLLPSWGICGDVSHIPGAFLDVGLGAKPMGMSGANIVFGRDVNSLLSNPAGLTSLRGQEAAFSMTKQFTLIPYNTVLYGQNFGRRNAIGIGFVTSGDEALKENTVIMSYARILPGAHAVGLSFKYRHASFGDNSDGAWDYEGGNRQVKGTGSGYGVDIGIRGKLGKRMGYGILLKDAISSVKWDASNEVGTAEGGSEGVPTSLIFGVGYMVKQYLTFEFNLKNGLYDDTSDRFYLGAERNLFSLINLRGGFSQNINDNEANRYYALGFGLGRGFGLMSLDLDFAYLINDVQNYYHIGLKIGRSPK